MNRSDTRLLLIAASILAVLCVAPFSNAQDSWRAIQYDVVYGHKAGMALTYDIVRPTEDPNGAAIAFMVSGGWVSRHFEAEGFFRENVPEKANVFEQLVQEGYTLYLVRHGSSPYFKVPDAVADVRKAIAHIRDHCEGIKVDKNRIGAFGMSAGGHLSLMLGTTGNDEGGESSVAAVAAYFPPTNLEGMVGPEKDIAKQFPALAFSNDLADDVSPLLFVTKDDAPSLMVHGTEDRLVPIWHSEKIHKAFEDAGVESNLIVIEGAAHGFQNKDAEKAEAAVIEWFGKHLAK